MLWFLTTQLIGALVLDVIIGDPRCRFHPVRIIGYCGALLAKRARTLCRHERLAGVLTALVLPLASGGAGVCVLYIAAFMHPAITWVAGLIFIYSAVAGRDLASHAMRVYHALREGRLGQARERVGMFVGRDTDDLDKQGITRAAVESIAESTVDSVTAALFYALVFGPVGALVYRVINTMDAMYGYKEGSYLRFGWACARLDDAANLIPARLTAPFMIAAAFLLRLDAKGAFRILRRDRRNHTSPNAGWSESVMAGALNVQLGGPSRYFGKLKNKPYIGTASMSPRARHIKEAVQVMALTTGLFLVAGVSGRYLFLAAF